MLSLRQVRLMMIIVPICCGLLVADCCGIGKG